MKATTGTRRSLRAPLLIAAFAGLAATASGCIIDSDPPPCLPDILVDWAIETGGGTPVTCASAGASFVGADVNGSAFDAVCPAGATFGTIAIPAAGPGNYSVVLRLLTAGGADVVPPTPALPVNVPSCGDILVAEEAVFVLP